MKKQKRTGDNRFQVGHVAGMRITAHASALITFMLMWLVFRSIAHFSIGLPITEALVGGLAAVILHYSSEFVHQIGHSIAARQTGYPMIGIYFFGPLALSIYPKDEPALPGRLHIKRALGGPIASLLLSLVLGGLLWLQTLHSGLVWWLLLFLFVDNLVVFTLGAMLPLGFTDGSTILRWWGK